MALVWLIAQHFLFGLIGTAVNVGNIQPSTAGMYSLYTSKKYSIFLLQ